MPQVLSSPVFGGSGPPRKGTEDAGRGWDVPSDQKPAGPYPEEKLLRRGPAVICGDPPQCDRNLQEGQL